ncbi:MAG TPA: nucleotidyltransferase family protein [Acidimicrobiales bacterium]|nr:nucleotidyltransferase family protein [Acidimicrobiales bacterium]
MPRDFSAVVTLAIDAATVEVSKAFADEDIEFRLLKGPVLAAWLYPDDERPYGDTDLLIPATATDGAHDILLRLGYRRRPNVVLKGDRPWHATTYQRSDGRMVDVHVTLQGLEAPTEQVWQTLSQAAGSITLFGHRVPTLSTVGLLLHLALHAAQHHDEEKPLEDLRRALDVTSIDEWSLAAELAGALDGLRPFTEGLSRVGTGRLVQNRIGLDPLHRDEHHNVDRSLEWLAGLPLRKRLSLGLHKLLPPPEFQREYDPRARSGALGLALSYPRRWWRLAAASATWALRKTRTARREPSGDGENGIG